MRNLLSATAALALLVAAGQAGAQTAAAHSDSSAVPQSSAPSDNTMAQTPGTTPTNDNQSNTQTGADQAAKPVHHASGEGTANRREAKITDKLNEQQLSGNSNASSMSNSGSSSDTAKTSGKAKSGWKANHKSESTQPADVAGSGSSLGASPSPEAGSDTVGTHNSTPQTTGDRAASPDSPSPESVGSMPGSPNGD